MSKPYVRQYKLRTSTSRRESSTAHRVPPTSSRLRLARLAADSGLDGVVASPQESRSIREAVAKPGFTIVTPGIRGASATNDDQRRVTTFMQAIQNGSDYVVIGRPIIQSADRRDAVRQIVEGAENKR